MAQRGRESGRRFFLPGGAPVWIFVLLLLAIVSLAAFLWARSVFGQDAVRAELAAQLSQSLGQPVTVARLDVALSPRLTLNLGGVAIGSPARIQIQTLHIETN